MVLGTTRRGFTLTELLIVITILAILSGLALSALSGASEEARAQRTRAIISKLDQLIMEKWDGYLTRSVQISATNMTALRSNANAPRAFAVARVNALRELQRMEMPDRKSDIADGNALRATATGIAISAAQRGYFRKASAATGGDLSKWTTTHEGSECLYLILAASRGDSDVLASFSSGEIGDTDGDGMKEILDGWGNPIEFIRWPAGFTVQAGCVTMQTTVANQNPDPFDPMKADSRASDADATNDPYALFPLLFSPGPDKAYAINVGGGVVYTAMTPANDPYWGSTPQVGSPIGTTEWADNITNHAPQTP